MDSYLIDNQDLIREMKNRWTISWLDVWAKVWIFDRHYPRNRWRKLVAAWKIHDSVSNIKYSEETIVNRYENRNEEINEITTSKESNWIHEIKYEWWVIKNREEFMSHISFDQTKYEVLSYQCNLRPVVIRTWPNETTLVNKYEHFLRTKPFSWFNIDLLLEKVKDSLQSYEYNVEKYNCSNKWDKALQICIFDAHINKKSFSWWEWNCSIAKDVYTRMVHDMCMKWISYSDEIEEVVLVIWQDFFNSDLWSRTTSWTPQDNVENEEDAFEAWLNIIIESVSIIKNIVWSRIKIISIPWNHARTLEQVLWTALSVIYRWDDSVEVDYSNQHRKYRSFWNSSVMLCHWDWANKSTYPMIFANERPDLWSSSLYREVHQWHIHTQTVNEINWVIIRTLSSTTTTDKWHDKNNYCFNIRWWQMFVWDKLKWNEAQFNFYI